MTIDKPLKITTEQVATTGFRPHGIIELVMDGDLLHYGCTGPFNKELLECMAVAQMTFLKAMKHPGPWASIATFLGSVMSSPEGIQRYAELMQTPHPPELTPVATAFFIGPEVEGGSIMIPHFARIYAEIGRPFKAFKTMAEAQSWALSMIEASRAPC